MAQAAHIRVADETTFFGLPEGTRVHLSVEEQTSVAPAQHVAKIHSPKLARPEDAADFVMDVRETGNAGV